MDELRRTKFLYRGKSLLRVENRIVEGVGRLILLHLRVERKGMSFLQLP
jgi:hypothetical protein